MNKKWLGFGLIIFRAPLGKEVSISTKPMLYLPWPDDRRGLLIVEPLFVGVLEDSCLMLARYHHVSSHQRRFKESAKGEKRRRRRREMKKSFYTKFS